MEPLKKKPLKYPFGFDASSIEKEIHDEKRLQRQICMCGHPSTAHQVSDETKLVMCSVAKSFCPCDGIIPAVEVADKRVFKHTTSGSDGLHALSKGIRVALRNGAVVTSIRDNVCFACKNAAERLFAVAITRNGHLGFSPQAKNGLVCEICYVSLNAGTSISDLLK